MKLFYKNEFLKNITEEEAQKIANYSGHQIFFDGEFLKKSQIEIRKEITETQEKRINEYTLEELHSILGNFEKEYHEATTGNHIHNEILGNVHEGNVAHALRLGAITRYKFDKIRKPNEWTYFVKLPEYVNYQLKVEALKELNRRRDYKKEEKKLEFSEMIKSF